MSKQKLSVGHPLHVREREKIICVVHHFEVGVVNSPTLWKLAKVYALQAQVFKF